MNLSVGILGFGYLGNELIHTLGDDKKIWVTRQQVSDAVEYPEPRYLSFRFNWHDSESWRNLPDEESVLIITIPPLSKDISEETNRLGCWCKWIRKNRPGFKRCVYISSTGVYPNLPGIWTEKSEFECDSAKGELRLVGEKVLADYFDTRVIRSGAIYGEARNIGRRILAGKAIPGGVQPVHRIHVYDLARLVAKAVSEPQFPDLVNAVDMKSETTRKVAGWLMKQEFFPKTKETDLKFQVDFETRKFNLSQPDRKICNQRLVAECNFSFIFPTYKEGLFQAFSQASHQA